MTARWRRLAGATIGTAFRAAPGTTVACLLMSVAAAVASVTYAIGFKEVTDGAIAHNAGSIAFGVVLVAGLFTASWVLAIVSGTTGTLLTDRVNLVLGVRIARLAATAPTLEHLERSDLLARLEQLTQNRRTMAGAPRQLIGLFGQTLRAIGIVVLLATIYLPVLVIPLLALAPALSDRWAARVQQRADDSLAEDRRLLGGLFAFATSPDSAREVRSYGISDALTRRHAELTERVRRRSVRAALLSAGLEAVGWLVFAAGLIAAIVVLVLRAVDGDVTQARSSWPFRSCAARRPRSRARRTPRGNFNTALAAARQLLWLEDHTEQARRPARGHTRGAGPPELGNHARGTHLRLPGQRGGAPARADRPRAPGRADDRAGGRERRRQDTLVKLLCGMYTPTAGRIALDGVDLTEISPTDWRERVTGAFQDFQRLQLILAESVGVGDLPRVEDHPTVRGAMERAGTARLEERLPAGSGHARRRPVHGRARAVRRTVAAARPGPRPDAPHAAAGRSRRADREPRCTQRGRAVRPLHRRRP